MSQSGNSDFGKRLTIPDLWQRRALSFLRDGKDVVLHAPTGAGKTFVFELLMESGWRGKAIYAVPTRALANDKFREWRARGWEVGLVTGDVRHKPDASVVVATMETQRSAILRGDGPDLFVIDEYQLLSDPQRGPGYEVCIASTPAATQLLLMSGSVANPEEVSDWLSSCGRNVEMVSEGKRPVPLEEVFAETITRNSSRSGIRGYWPRLVAKAIELDMGPVLLFAPRRSAAEQLASQLAAEMPEVFPLELTSEQKHVSGKKLSSLLRKRVAFHHSGLDYVRRAGVIEPLAKAGQLRAVVATTGLAAGINFSMRTVVVTDREYRINNERILLRPDELLQMFGRAGRRGLDDRGFVLAVPKRPRMREGRPLKLKRSKSIDWPAMIRVMHHAVERGRSPTKAVRGMAARLFSEDKVLLGLEESFGKLNSPNKLQRQLRGQEKRNPERDQLIEMRNSSGQWERQKGRTKARLRDALVLVDDEWLPALSLPDTLEKVRIGNPCRFGGKRNPTYGREVPVAAIDKESAYERVLLIKSFRRRLREALANDSAQRRRKFTKKAWKRRGLEKVFAPIFPLLSFGGKLAEFVDRGGVLHARLSYEDATVLGWRDAKGRVLINPILRKSHREFVSPFSEKDSASSRPLANALPAESWCRLGLIDEMARPTRRGVVFSFFSRGEGLAIAAALEDETYPLEDLVQDLANLRAGHRFSSYSKTDCRLAFVCRQAYGFSDCPGYLRNGVPPEYGEGAADVLREKPGKVPHARESLDEELRIGDIERARIEWLSLLSLIAKAPSLEWSRWQELQFAAKLAASSLGEKQSLPELPEVPVRQRRRHKLVSSRS